MTIETALERFVGCRLMDACSVEVMELVKTAVLHEREECAKDVESLDKHVHVAKAFTSDKDICKAIAAAIRARGNG